ncbi:DUF917 domain-containing protein [Paenibacillus radicis (ex Gao et al. 2016)]|uniref:DUF917 domain-containing protein n=1 Tax=Paenibacillus radicis (ex Gao et al. 2016) TaxID=1737354 RepID=A0A917M7P0_9BACL|nr:DUF917 domain-containing protein [Paenibacillus radicis (ex Gao et al. 2016)]GGG83047.1 hypothetical protein GCM10010918_45740 [Paenibacillus radicis (ex Gao et al. 2016)]
MRELTKDDVIAAVKGGSVFASGGGGWVEHGLEIGNAAVALGRPKLVSADELPDDAIIITCTAIGAPAGTDWQMLGKDYVRAVQLLFEQYDGKIVGVMTPQNGMSSSINGWLPAAALGLVVVDATGDIRAHPTGKMGSLGLASRTDFETIQAVAGGKPELGSYIELTVKGTPARTSNILRTASDMAGGFIAAARHPLPAKYVKEHAALGGVSIAIDLGRAIIDAEPQGPEQVLKTICRKTGGRFVGKGKVVKKDVSYSGAFDIGTIEVEKGKKKLKLHVMNEYMAVEDQEGTRVSTFPDVITTFNLDTGLPVSVGHIEEGQRIGVFVIDKSLLPLSSSVKDPSVYPEVEKALGIELLKYALEDEPATVVSAHA